MKKLCALTLSLAMAMSLSLPAFASNHIDTPTGASSISTFCSVDGIEYEYIKYSSPVSYEYDGTTHTLLGTVRPKQSYSGISTYDYREWTEWSIIDYGIEQSWMYMSKPYFVKSIARGEKFESEIKKQISLSPKVSINIPSGSQDAVNKALKGEFSLGLTGEYSKTIRISLSGPEGNYNTRTFYYKTGFHQHDITIVETVRSNWDGILSRTEHTNCYGYEPAVRSYSEDENI